MKTTTDRIKRISLTAVLIVISMACNKIPIEEIKFPDTVDMIVGQNCVMKILLYEDPYYDQSTSVSIVGIPIIDEHEGPMYYHSVTAFSDWHSNNPEIIEMRGDTLFALATGACDVTANYHDNLGDHTVTCSIIVNDLDIPNPEDTLFIHSGDTIELCKFDAPGFYTINYELKYSSGYIYSSHLDSYYNSISVSYEPSPIKLSPLYTYYKNMIAPEFGITSFRVFCDPLGIDVTIPIVTLPSGDSKVQ